MGVLSESLNHSLTDSLKTSCISRPSDILLKFMCLIIYYDTVDLSVYGSCMFYFRIQIADLSPMLQKACRDFCHTIVENQKSHFYT